MKLYSVFEEKMIRNEGLSLFDSDFYFDIDKYCKAINDYIEQTSSQNSNPLLYDGIKKFYSKYDFLESSEQQKLLCRIKAGADIVMYAYQPNIFMSVSAFASFVQMERVRITLREQYHKDIVPIYLIVNYDTPFDRRFIHSFIPNIGKENCKRYLNYPERLLLGRNIMFEASRPSRELFDSWVNCYRRTIEELLITIKKSQIGYYNDIKNNMNQIIFYMKEAFNKCTSLSEFNSIFLHYVINDLLHLNCLFIEGQVYHSIFSHNLSEIELNRKQVNSWVNTFIANLRRMGIESTFRERPPDASYTWKYRTECARRCDINITCYTDCAYDLTFPNVIADYLLDYTAMIKKGDVGYCKQFEGILLSDFIIKHWHNIKSCPHFLSNKSINPFDSFPDNEKKAIFECLLRKGADIKKYIQSVSDSHCSILFPLTLLGCENTINFL